MKMQPFSSSPLIFSLSCRLKGFCSRGPAAAAAAAAAVLLQP